MGRPSSFTQEKADEICARISDGESLREICREEGMPAWRTVFDWEESQPDFRNRILRARERGYHAIAHEALKIADTPIEGITEKVTDKGVEYTKEDMLGHRKLQIETRLKLLAKWCPRLYGDKLEVEAKHEAGDSLTKLFAQIRSRKGQNDA
jgi:predicted secreted protein